MLNSHTVSSGASMITSCLERNGGLMWLKQFSYDMSTQQNCYDRYPCQEAQPTSTLCGRLGWRCPAWKRAQLTAHPHSRFTENFWHVCLLIVRLSRVHLPFAWTSTTALNCSQQTRMSTT